MTQPQPHTSSVTRAVRAGVDTDPTHGSVIPPLYLSSNYSFAAFGEKRQYDYTRSGNPTRDDLGQALADLEGGAGGIITCTGMSAITLCLQALVPTGATVVVPHDCYGGTWRLFDSLHERGQIRVVTADFTDADSLAEALAQEPAVVWIETPSNPLLRITDVTAVAKAAHAVGAVVVADNTFLSPILQRPLELGADVVVHSTTKYINGHSDVVGGAVIGGTQELTDLLGQWANTLGLTGSPFDSYLTLRGLRTLHTRLRAHQENVEALLPLLTEHPAVRAVHHPGLPEHPGHEIAARQQFGFGAMLSFDLHGGEDAARALVEGLEFFSLAESLGGTESLIAHPATMTHASMSAEAREVAGIGCGLLRVSVGIEAPQDLLADLRAGLDRAARVSTTASAAVTSDTSGSHAPAHA